MNSLTGNGSQTFSIPARGRYVTTLTSAVRVQSSEALAAIERSQPPGKLGIDAAVSVTEAASALVFPHSVIGGGYTSSLMLANVSGTTQTFSVAGPGVQSAVIVLEPNRSIQVGIAQRISGVTVGAVTVNPVGIVPQPPGLVGVLDIENETGLVTIGARPASTTFAFPYVANGNGLFTGLALATGGNAASITVEIYDSTGGTPKSSTFTLGANQQLGRLVSELVPGVGNQLGGYIRIHSDQPIWAWEIYGSGQVMASGPPL
jgi:hypothetical protein